MKALYITWMCTSPDNNKLLNDNIKYLGVGGHLFAIAAKKSVDNGFDGYLYGFAANQELLKHYITVFNAESIGILHPYQFAIDETNALEIMEEVVITLQKNMKRTNWSLPMKKSAKCSASNIFLTET